MCSWLGTIPKSTCYWKFVPWISYKVRFRSNSPQIWVIETPSYWTKRLGDRVEIRFSDEIKQWILTKSMHNHNINSINLMSPVISIGHILNILAWLRGIQDKIRSQFSESWIQKKTDTWVFILKASEPWILNIDISNAAYHSGTIAWHP